LPVPGSTDRNKLPEQHSHEVDLDPRLSRMLAEEFPDLIQRYEEMRALYGVISKLTALRKEQGLTQAQLAERLGRPQSLISLVESGRMSPHIETIVAIARELGRSVRIELDPLQDAPLHDDGQLPSPPRASSNGRRRRAQKS
jgi:transcriptional regulator with XRE-family HTH domain